MLFTNHCRRANPSGNCHQHIADGQLRAGQFAFVNSVSNVFQITFNDLAVNNIEYAEKLYAVIGIK